MLDRLIQAQIDTATRIGRIVQRISRLVALPALLLMLGGLLLYVTSGAARGTALPGPPSIRLGHLLDFAAPVAGNAAAESDGEAARPVNATPAVRVADVIMSLGLLGLALVPGITVAVIFVEHVRARRWRDALVALVVVGVLTLSVVLGKG